LQEFFGEDLTQRRRGAKDAKKGEEEGRKVFTTEMCVGEGAAFLFAFVCLLAHQKCVTLILMDEKSCVIYSGPKFSIEWYFDKNGKSAAYDYFEESTEELQDKFLVLVKRILAIKYRQDYLERKTGGKK